MNYALIVNGLVTNLIWLYPGNAADFPDAVSLGDVPAAIGDAYADGAFYRDGVRVLSVSEQLAAAQAALAEIEEALNNG